MRRIATLFLFVALVAVGCDSGGPDPESEPQVDPPTAAFSADPTAVEVGGEVSFTAESENATSWEWDFGDGGSSTSQNPDHTYSEEGTYTVSLTVANEDGEEDTETKEDYVTVDPEPPVAAFSADPTEVVAGEDVNFTNESENATAWEWDFGDGNTSTEENPTHTYEEGSYTVSLTASNDAGAEDTETKENYITVNPEPTPPEADFEADQTTVEVADTVLFTDNSTNDPTSWEWDFGDGAISEEQNPIHVYEEPGDYDVSLTATNDDGSDTETKTSYITVEDQRTFSVRYEVDATFPECDVRYENESGGSTSRTINFDDRDDPWTLSLEMIVRGELSTEFARVRVSCFEFEANETASAKLYIDGELFDEGEETGESVSIRLSAALTLDGAEHY